MAVDLQQLAQVLEASLDPSKNKKGESGSKKAGKEADGGTAELAIRQEEKKPRFSLALLQIVANESYSSTVRLASALYFKNFVKREWVVRFIGSRMSGNTDVDCRMTMEATNCRKMRPQRSSKS